MSRQSNAASVRGIVSHFGMFSHSFVPFVTFITCHVRIAGGIKEPEEAKRLLPGSSANRDEP